MYLWFSLFMAVVGGAFAGMIRGQLARPDSGLMTPEFYSQIVSMHGTLMIFFVVIPALTGFGNYFVPLLIGARDMAFPRLNAFSYWVGIPAVVLILAVGVWLW